MDDLIALAQRRPRTRWAGRPLVLLAETDSTNDDARKAAASGAPHGHAIVADAQRAGRGRRGRVWHSPAGDNVYLSLVVRPGLAPSAAPLITLAAGLAVADAVAPRVPDRAVTIKWPNDVRIDGRKVAGVLVEGSLRGDRLAFAVVGVGVNVRGASLPTELVSIATTVCIAAGRTDVSRAAVLEALLVALEDRLDALVARGAADTVAAVSARCDTLGARVRVEGVGGTAESIGLDGALMVREDSGALVSVRAGEVTLG